VTRYVGWLRSSDGGDWQRVVIATCREVCAKLLLREALRHRIPERNRSITIHDMPRPSLVSATGKRSRKRRRKAEVAE
jgi:hypothetical protein